MGESPYKYYRTPVDTYFQFKEISLDCGKFRVGRW